MSQILYQEKMDGISIDRICREPGFTMPSKHLHNEYEIYFLVEGERYYFIGSQTYHVKKGGLVFIDRGLVHQTSQAGNESHDRILIGLEDTALAPFFALTGELSLSRFFEEHCGVLPLSEEDARTALGYLERIAAELQKKEGGYRLLVLSSLAALFFFAQRLFLKNKGNPLSAPLSASPKHRKVDEAAAYITEHYQEPLSLESVAKRLFVSKCYLSRIFKEAAGLTVVEYINLCRVRQARRLLLETSMSITELAECLGFESITYFERVFKKYTLVSPLKYRKTYSGSLEPVS